MQADVKHRAFENVTLTELEKVTRELLFLFSDVRVVVFHGEMGAGKTTLIKVISKALGVEDTMSSPTFSIVNEYHTKRGEAIFHFDFYRLKNELEAYDIGVEEYFDSGNYCFVEWPEKIPTLLPQRYAEVFITSTDPTHRTISLSMHE
jgi:tRNA threonylcarbamoyladenosine biosynthesis protein TsaE